MLAGKAAIASDLRLGRSGVLRSLRHSLPAGKSQGHHTIGRLEERGVERGSIHDDELPSKNEKGPSSIRKTHTHTHTHTRTRTHTHTHTHTHCGSCLKGNDGETSATRGRAHGFFYYGLFPRHRTGLKHMPTPLNKHVIYELSETATLCNPPPPPPAHPVTYKS